MSNCTCVEILKTIKTSSEEEKKALQQAIDLISGQADDRDLMKLIYEISLGILGDAPDEANCTDAENEVYAELANFVNAYPDYEGEL